MRTRGTVSALLTAVALAMATGACDLGESASTAPHPSFSWPTDVPSPSPSDSPTAAGPVHPSFDPEKFVPPSVSTAALKAEFDYDAAAPLRDTIFFGQQLPGGIGENSVAYFALGKRVTATIIVPATPNLSGAGIVFAHGGAPDRDAWLDEAVAFAQKGYFSILPDIPMTITGDPQQDIAYLKYAVVAERRAIDTLVDAEAPLLKPDNFAFVGHSWGGDLAAILAGVEPRFKAVVIVSGSSRMATDMLTLGRPADGLAYMSRVSLFDGYRYVALPGKRKVLIQFGTQDTSISTAQRDELTRSTSGSRTRDDYDAGHDLINFAPAAADRLKFLVAALA